jgi:hypothetical protein
MEMNKPNKSLEKNMTKLDTNQIKHKSESNFCGYGNTSNIPSVCLVNWATAHKIKMETNKPNKFLEKI